MTGLNQQTIPREGLAGYARVGATDTLWTFRVDSSAARDTPLVSIELRGHTILGVLNDGDEVAVVHGAAASGAPRRVRYVRNLTTGAIVQPGEESWDVRGDVEEQASTGGVHLPEVHGTVAGFAQRSESVGRRASANSQETDGKLTSVAVWTFRVHAAVPSRGPVVVPVEMREFGYIPGALRDGDEVAIASPWQHGVTLRPLSLENRSTGERIATHDLRRERSNDRRRGLLVVTLMVAGFLAWLVSKHPGTAGGGFDADAAVPVAIVLVVLGGMLKFFLNVQAARRYRRKATRTTPR